MRRVKIELTENQRKALDVLQDNKYKRIGYWGWAWGGKTFLWCVRVNMMCTKYPWVRYAFVRDTIKNIKNTTRASLQKFYWIYNIPKFMRWELKENKSAIVYPNWSVILLLEWCYYPSDPLYNRFGSLELTGAFVEESAEVPLEAINILTTRVWRFKNTEYWIKWKVLETFNPNPWHVYERFYKGKGWEESIFIESLVYSNNFIDEWYIENLEQADDKIKNRLLYGQWNFDDDVRMMYRMSDIHDLRDNKQNDGKYYIVCDVARFWVDTTRISLWKGNTWLRVWTYEKSSIKEVIESITLIAEQYWVDHWNIIVDADWVWGGVVDGLDYCIWFVNNSKPIETWVRQNYANLKSQCAFKLKELLEKHEIAIAWQHMNKAKDFELLEQELLNTYIDEKSIDWKTRIEPKEKIKERIWRSPDLLDTMIMRMLPYVRQDSQTNYIDNYFNSISR